MKTLLNAVDAIGDGSEIVPPRPLLCGVEDGVVRADCRQQPAR